MNGETDTNSVLSHLQLWQTFALAAGLSAISALLRALVDGARRGIWRKVWRVTSSAFWGGMAAILLSQWLKVNPETLVVMGAVFGWTGYEATLSTLMQLLQAKAGLKESPKK